MILRYANRSKPSALRIQDALIELGMNVSFMREATKGDVNWGRSRANTRLNPDISNSTDKRHMRALFAENDVPMPEYYSASHAAAMESGSSDFPIVGRPDHHTQGRGFWLCNTPEDVQRALKGTERKAGATHFMEFIQADKEVRVHIFKGKSIRMAEKLFNDEGYTTVKPTGDEAERGAARRAAKRAVRALGLDFGAVDILVKEGQPYVLEVNAAPGLGGTTPQAYAKAMKKWYER